MRTYEEDELLPISALAQLAYCERRCALMHLENLWADNRFTVLGAELHLKTHQGHDEVRDGVRICRGLPLRSLRLGLSGVADVVEFPLAPPTEDDPLAWLEGSSIPGGDSRVEESSLSAPFPVEYKRGKPKRDYSDAVQLCAQGICLEEMLGVEVPRGAFYYGKPRRRYLVEFTPALREETERLSHRLHELINSGTTPAAKFEPRKCRHCSLIDVCMPQSAGGGRSAKRYLQRMIHQARESSPLSFVEEELPPPARDVD